MITMEVTGNVNPKKEQEFLDALRSLTDSRSRHSGLRKRTLRQPAGDHTGFNLTYEWETQDDLERYLDNEDFKVLVGALKVLCDESEIRCSDSSKKSARSLVWHI